MIDIRCAMTMTVVPPRFASQIAVRSACSAPSTFELFVQNQQLRCAETARGRGDALSRPPESPKPASPTADLVAVIGRRS